MPTKPEFPYTLQQSLDIIVAHLKAGGKRSYAAFDLSCMYRGDSGAKCFFGLLIPDDVAKKYEGTCASGVLYSCYGVEKGPTLNAFDNLQEIHDHPGHWTAGEFNEEGWAALKEWAKDNNLTMQES